MSCRQYYRHEHGTGLAHFGIILNQGNEHIPSKWILLDTCSTNSVFNSSKFLKEIVVCSEDKNLTIFLNGGKQEYFLKSQMKLFPIAVNYNEESITNILSLKDLLNVDGLQVTMDSLKEKALVVTYNKFSYKFHQHASGFYYYDMNKDSPDKSNDKISPYSFLESVDTNKEFFHGTKLKERIGHANYNENSDGPA